ncbi:MAG: hypothetical protein DSY47_00090 [Hydrogenothermus sp.]|nr:MAG: hypothetical protein DSY47_00090 [Hydrogenothermus sp.]
MNKLNHKAKVNLKEFAKQTRERLINNIEDLVFHGDSAKFLSLLLVSTNDEKVLKAFKSYIKDGKFFRKPGVITKKAFSGDMFAGYSYALLDLFYKRELDKDPEFKNELIKVLENSIFKKPYFQIKSYSKTADRGYLIRWFFANAGHFLPVLTLLQLLWRLTRKRKYLLFYYAIFPIAALDIIINPTFAIRFKNYRYMQWYYIHSNFLYYQTLFKMTGNPVYLYGMKFMHRRFPFNPEFAAVMGDFETAYMHLTDYTYQSKEHNKKAELKFKKRIVKNLKDVIRRRPAEYEEFTEILPPRTRKNDYQWEKSMDWNEWKDTPLAGIDFLHVLSKISK